jgi:hypothetical protein
MDHGIASLRSSAYDADSAIECLWPNKINSNHERKNINGKCHICISGRMIVRLHQPKGLEIDSKGF